MSVFIIYIIRWSLVLTLLYSLFGLFLKHETLHGFNRIVLLVILVASMVMPLCQIEMQKATFVTQGREMIEQEIKSVEEKLMAFSRQETETARGTLQPTKPSEDTKTQPHPSLVGLGMEAVIVPVLIIFFLLGVIIGWICYFWHLESLLLLIRRSKRIDTENIPKDVRVLVHPDIKTPCSWMRWMILNPDDLNTRAIINHELAHIRLGHSWDMLLCELTCRMLWCVPFAWMLRQDLRDIHEYQADRRVLATGISDEEYQLLLIKKATSTGLQPVVNALNQSPIKQRFKMMYRKPSRRWVVLKAAYLLPLSTVALVAFARPQTLGEIEDKVETITPTLVESAKAVAQQLPSLTGEEKENGSMTSSDVEGNSAPSPVSSPIETGNGFAELPDSNLVAADLKDHEADNEAALYAIGLIKKQEMETVLDSVMNAVGARKIQEGVYVGHFQPNLNTDTLHIGTVNFLDKQSRQTAGLGLNIDEDDPLCYTMTLQEGTRKDETGYYIRQLTPVNSTAMHYEQKTEPWLRPADILKSDLAKMSEPIVIEQHPDETHVILYWPVEGDDQTLGADLSNWAIVDVETGDRYMCRSIENFEGKKMTGDVRNHQGEIIQFCLVFPPLGKQVRKVYVGNAKNQYYSETEIHNLANISRKPIQVIR